MKTKLLRPLALGAFAVALVSAPFISGAEAGGYHGHDRYEHWQEKKAKRAKAHRRMHKAGVPHRHYHEDRHHRRTHVREHRRKQYAKAHRHHHGHKKPTKVVYKVVKVEKTPRYDPQERLIYSLIEAVLAANVGTRYR